MSILVTPSNIKQLKTNHSYDRNKSVVLSHLFVRSQVAVVAMKKFVRIESEVHEILENFAYTFFFKLWTCCLIV